MLLYIRITRSPRPETPDGQGERDENQSFLRHHVHRHRRLRGDDQQRHGAGAPGNQQPQGAQGLLETLRGHRRHLQELREAWGVQRGGRGILLVQDPLPRHLVRGLRAVRRLQPVGPTQGLLGPREPAPICRLRLLHEGLRVRATPVHPRGKNPRVERSQGISRTQGQPRPGVLVGDREVPSGTRVQEVDHRSGNDAHKRPATPRRSCWSFNVYASIFGILWGLCIMQDLFEQRSGMVFVPSIIKLPHSLQILPVGLALIANLQLG